MFSISSGHRVPGLFPLKILHLPVLVENNPDDSSAFLLVEMKQNRVSRHAIVP
jgi:hypothetical protein